MEIHTENPLLLRAPGKGVGLFLKACKGHGCVGHPAGPARSHPGWLGAILKAPQYTTFCHAPHETMIVTVKISLFTAEEQAW